MIPEQEYMLRAMNDYIHGEKTANNTDVDWQTIYSYARSHQITAIIYQQCKDYLPESVADKFKTIALNTVFINIQRKKITEDAVEMLRGNNIDTFLIKGDVLSAFYPDKNHRTMGDTDFVVDDLERAHELFIANGFNSSTKIKDREYQYYRSNMEFELHDRLVYDESINEDKITHYLNGFREYVSDGRLDDSFHFIFVLNHLRKHFMNSGVGLRQFLDVALMIKNGPELRWDWIEENLDKIGLLSFAKVVFYYIEKWFGVTSPIERTEVEDDVFERSTAYVFANGVFGTDNEENNDFTAANNARKSKFPLLAMIKSAIQKIFPSYRALSAVEKYSFLRGKPYLLLAAWVYRMIRGIKDKGADHGKEMINNAFVSKEYIDKREEMFHNWGIS